MNRKEERIIREPVVEGIFYPKRRGDLESLVWKSLETASASRGSAHGLILPHAGYSYCSGLLAAGFSAAAEGKPERIVCVATVHREESDSIFLTESSAFRTPLGEIPVDIGGGEQLMGYTTIIVKNDIPHLEEHSIEVLLPYLQTVFPGTPFLPILLGKNSSAIARVLAMAFTGAFGRPSDNTLFIISSSLARNSTPEKARESAEKLVSLTDRGDAESILKAHERKEISACGTAGIAGLVTYLGEAYRAELHGMNAAHPELDGKGETIQFGSIAFHRKD